MDMLDYVNRIEELRGERNWTLADLCNKAGISPSTISSMRNNTDISMRTIETLCKAFEISLSDFFIKPNQQRKEILSQQEELLFLLLSCIFQ